MACYNHDIIMVGAVDMVVTLVDSMLVQLQIVDEMMNAGVSCCLLKNKLATGWKRSNDKEEE